ncbi:MAG: endonuclease NucS, partial [Nitrososphaerota archaeon]
MTSVEEAVREIMLAVSAGRFVVVLGEMEVVYEGRSLSWLGKGERLVIIKQDKSVLVHRPTGYEPVNWQPSGSHIEAWTEDG